MSERRTSSVLKILREVPEGRKIAKFPSPFRKDCSPYNCENFDLCVEDACSKENFFSTADLKICKVIILGDLAVGKTCIVNRSAINYKVSILVVY